MRSCGTCSLCCKVSAIEALEKPQGQWCPHAHPGRGGCAIHGAHPHECQTYACAWLQRPDLAEDWKPSVSRMVLRIEGPGVFVHVDLDHPDAWKKEPYYARLKRIAQGLWHGMSNVIVYVGTQLTVVFAEEDLTIGAPAEGDTVTVSYLMTPLSRQPCVRVIGASGEENRYLGAIYPIMAAAEVRTPFAPSAGRFGPSLELGRQLRHRAPLSWRPPLAAALRFHLSLDLPDGRSQAKSIPLTRRHAPFAPRAEGQSSRRGQGHGRTSPSAPHRPEDRHVPRPSDSDAEGRLRLHSLRLR